ncbi:hypothetical protein SAMN05444365_104180 [Micromonospora pattaloongensis]|uniref:BNR repeat-containing family member n=1 Tax=Micromonospora pattaloongensis TaxID=405436 RepID=A0A1H3NW72_9ACTN|nr:hypothetical protein [Micromonospora pattaloongensis]SDY92775.1 hypothetical protein SAMN05444365_104180 [Micromonospora pattaloongensis]
MKTHLRRKHLRLLLAAPLGALLTVTPLPGPLSPPSEAAAGKVGYAGPSTSGDGPAATAEKAESKLWWNDGFWWASMFHTASETHHIYRLDRRTQRWRDTGTVLDPRPKTRADTLWDGSRLYVASRVRAGSSAEATAGNPARLFRYSYNRSTKRYTRDAGFPTQINNYSSETLTIDRDTKGVLWATWAQGSKIYVNSTLPGTARWGTPFVIPARGATTVSSDDISAVVTMRDGRIGVMWSNQRESAVYFALHNDAAARTKWSVRSTAVKGTGYADDHISLRSLQSGPGGRLFAVVKTSLNDRTSPASAPQILLLARNPKTGAWTRATVGRIADCHTQPVLILDAARQMLHVFLTAPDRGCPYSGVAGTIFKKSSPMNRIAFPTGRGTPVIRDVASPNLNHVTSTKQSVSKASGLVILASNDVTQRYWHADVAPRP